MTFQFNPFVNKLNRMFEARPSIVETIFAENAQLITNEAPNLDPLMPWLWKLEIDPTIISDEQFPTTYLNQACLFENEVQALCQKTTIQQTLLTSQETNQKQQNGQIGFQTSQEINESFPMHSKIEEGLGYASTLKSRLTVVTENTNGVVKSEQASSSHNLQQINGHQQQLKINHTLNYQGYDKFIAILKKREYRLDQIFKVTIRFLSKQAREIFQCFMKENDITQTHPSEVKDQLLKLFIRQHFNLEVKPDQIDIAKSFFFTFSLKTKQPMGQTAKEKVARLRNSFVEKGTLKEALLFFSSQIGLQCFFINFVHHILEAVKYTSCEGRRLYERGLRKLINRLRSKRNSDRDILNEAEEIIDSFGS